MTNEIPPLNVAQLLRQYGLPPLKRLGQNFLVDPAALQKVVRAAEISPDDAVLEVGAGLGSLTRYLALQAKIVVAVELDARLFPILTSLLSPYPNVRLVEGDILQLDPGKLMEQQGYLVVANIPYYITSALIRHLLEAQVLPKRLVLTIQREVAWRICAQPGEMSLLALSVQVYGSAHIVGEIPAGAFYPMPKVDSAILRIDLYPQPRLPPPLLPTFFHLAKGGFSHKRKTLRNALAASLGMKPTMLDEMLTAAEINPQRRAESLSLEEWQRLCQIYRQWNEEVNPR